jgi:hypothetical protein
MEAHKVTESPISVIPAKAGIQELFRAQELPGPRLSPGRRLFYVWVALLRG